MSNPLRHELLGSVTWCCGTHGVANCPLCWTQRDAEPLARHELLSDPKCRCLRVSGHDLGCPQRIEGPYRNGLWTVGEERNEFDADANRHMVRHSDTLPASPVQNVEAIAYREWSAAEYDQASRPGAKDPFDPDPRALEPAKNGWVWCERCESPRDLASREHDCNGEFR